MSEDIKVAEVVAREGGERLSVKLMRNRGWSVAVHNDYKIQDKWFTFWLFTHPDGRYVKGEGVTDEEAIREALKSSISSTPTPPEAASAGAEKGAGEDERISELGEPKIPWEDARVQKVYELLNAEAWPANREEHWEGWIARHIVDAICTPLPSPVGDESHDWNFKVEATMRPVYDEQDSEEAETILRTSSDSDKRVYLAQGIAGYRKWKLKVPAASPVAEGELPATQITDEDVARWKKYNDDEDPTHEAYIEFHVRERQLRAAIGRAEKAEAERAKAVDDRWNTLLKLEAMQDRAFAAEAELTTLKQVAEEMAEALRYAKEIVDDQAQRFHKDCRCQLCESLPENIDAALSKYEAVKQATEGKK